ncbi:hypothetical protein Spla01_01395 [Streptomyces platensis]|uniref:Uncharacterized protein n=1 Tax=Streptomyces platensis TaxID=58346 RepID=A0ABX3Y5T5_STRPT|nr:hypothetical protein BG653_00670 [Streptomyces platensis]
MGDPQTPIIKIHTKSVRLSVYRIPPWLLVSFATIVGSGSVGWAITNR